MIAPQAAVEAKLLAVRFQRGPEHSNCSFAVKAVPITWMALPDGPLPDNFMAERNVHYVYENGLEVDTLPWVYSENAASTQRATLSLDVGHDYEIWVRLRDPANSTRWLEQDPNRAHE